MDFDNYQLPLHNPWWDEAFDVGKETKLKELGTAKFIYRHPLTWEFPENSDVVFTLRGPRRIGKTTLLKQIIAGLIRNGHQRQKILYFPCDRIKDFNEIYFLIQNFVLEARAENDRRLFLFIDEISSVADWQRAVKALADDGFLKNTTAILTGSNALDLKKSSERLPGRTGKWFKSDKTFLPLNFKEFYRLTHPQWDAKVHFQEIPKYKKA
ncbi:AAA family ATPase, partial [Candidatus Microgenomates bacterium]|nr:AAA family ATPase [Candidatus Microgenomates bacterium]